MFRWYFRAVGIVQGEIIDLDHTEPWNDGWHRRSVCL